ncbi:MAG: hypothetical protein WC924_05595 [Candidatus Gracilibacteria bacterium]
MPAFFSPNMRETLRRCASNEGEAYPSVRRTEQPAEVREQFQRTQSGTAEALSGPEASK